jgi:hypothetical protein
MPLARYSLYAWDVQIYLAPTWDRGEPGLSTLRHIAKEGRVYVAGCSIAMRKEDIPDRFEFKAKYYADAREWINSGDSAVVGPDGKFVAAQRRGRNPLRRARRQADARSSGTSTWPATTRGRMCSGSPSARKTGRCSPLPKRRGGSRVTRPKR